MTNGAPHDLFDLVIFDEAHHAPAESCAAYLDYYPSALSAVADVRYRRPERQQSV